MKCPEILYKYYDNRGAAVLEDLKIKVSLPAEFNDPFEFAPVLVGKPSREQVERLIRDPKWARFSYPTRKFRGSLKEYQKYLHENAGSFAEILHRNKNWAEHQVAESFKKSATETTGVFCVSRRNNGILMWSHYADKHRGFLIGFEGTPWRDSDQGFFRVKYSGKRPEVNVANSVAGGDLSSGNRAFLAAITTKSLEWQYEEEYRAVFSLAGIKPTLIGSPPTPAFLIPIVPTIIREVVVGARCPPADEEKIRSLLKAAHFSHVMLKKAVLDSKQFAICVQPT